MDASTVIRHEGNRFADVLAATDPSASVPTCPDWSAADLLWHLTEVHLFWSAILAEGARTGAEVAAIDEGKPPRPDTIGETLAIREQATTALANQLSNLSDTESRWTWWTRDQTVGFTRRMQVCEVTMHRVDAELTAGAAVTPIGDDVATLAVDHCIDVMRAWLPDWASWEHVATVEFRATDTGQSWLVDLGPVAGVEPGGGEETWQRITRAAAGATPTATVTGTVQQLARWTWNRGCEVTVTGTDHAVAAITAAITEGLD